MLINEGDEVLEITSFVPEHPAFVVVSPVFPIELEPGAEQEVELSWTCSGDLEAIGMVASNDPDEDFVDVPLFGRLAVPRLEIRPGDVDFDTIPPGCEEATTFTLVSTGEMPVTVSDVGITGEGFALMDELPLPLELDPGEKYPVAVSFAPDIEGAYTGSLVAQSDDPLGEDLAGLAGSGLIDATCDGLGFGELIFDVQYERADVAFIVDNTMSMLPVIVAFESEIASIFSELRSTIPDLTIGYARHEDYKPDPGTDSRPFRLFQQQTDDIGLAVATVAIHFDNISGGFDWEEASSEALYQAATGEGYDQNCNASFDLDEDVRPFVASPFDAFRGTAAGKFDPTIPGTGENGGMGFREGVLPIFISATDAEMKDPERGHWTPGGCPQDASVYNAITAVNELGGKFIGIEVLSGGESSPFGQMQSIAIATHSYGDLDGDYITEPAVTIWDPSDEPITFRRSIVNAVEALAAAAIFDVVELQVFNDPQGLIVDIEPDLYTDVTAGTELIFHLTVQGRFSQTPTADAEEAELHLVADDSIILAERTVYIVPE